MEFRIADTFTDSLTRLTGEEQKAVKTAAFDLQLNPASPGLSFHKLDRARDKNFWSVRVGRDLRLIVHRSDASLLLCFVGHHDKAYDWAERRRLETHPKTGAAQLVEIRETVKEVVVSVFVQSEVARAPTAPTKRAPLFEHVSDEHLLGYGVPAEWLSDVRGATEDTLLAVADHLPSEAAEALLELATGGKPKVAQPVASDASPFDHPDALRRFRVMTNVEELERALEFPWDKWTVFLHPEQRQWVERDYAGPARVAGSAGTGKTIVAVHRAAHLARAHPNARILLTTFSDTLARALHTKLKRLLGNEPRLAERIDVEALDAVGARLHKAQIGPVALANRATLLQLIKESAASEPDHKFSTHFLVTEWEHVIDAWQIRSWDAYRDVARLGRKTRLPEPQRRVLWSIFERVHAALRERKLTTTSEMFTALASALTQVKKPVFDFAVIDEAQDVSVAQLRFLAALGADRPNGLFFAGDLGQRIFQQPFSWKSLGVDVRGRSRTLRVNYRTSHQIRSQADRLLDPTLTDTDGLIEERHGTVSVFNGPAPLVFVLQSEVAECDAVATWLKDRTKDGVAPHEIGVFVRSDAEIDRAVAAVKAAKLAYKLLDSNVETTSHQISISTMHLAKGLEFRAVAVMACDDEIIPLQSRITSVGDDGDLREVYETERHLLYVACTRARDQLLVTACEPASEFLSDLTDR
jgi:mRNA-degrading endonuclease RelE of RelBE toxin-antitoxin system